MAKLIYFVFVLLLADAFAIINNIHTANYSSIPEECIVEVDPHPFIKIGRKYYVVETRAYVNWYEAHHRCRILGGDLATIESADEMDALTDYLLSIGQTYNWLWVGGTDLAEEGTFKHISNGQPMLYTKWRPGQPDNYQNDEHCVHLSLRDNTSYLNDFVCKDNSNYICELEDPQIVSFKSS